MGNQTFQGNVSVRLNSTGRSNFTLRMAPMIDMIFLLLIFFLVAAKWRPQEDFIPFKLPAAHAQTLAMARPEPLTIHIFSTPTGCQVRLGQLYTVKIDDETINADMLVLIEQMEKCLLSQKRFASDPVEIICEPAVKWEHLAKIYNMFYGAGLTDITLPMTE